MGSVIFVTVTKTHMEKDDSDLMPKLTENTELRDHFIQKLRENMIMIEKELMSRVLSIVSENRPGCAWRWTSTVPPPCWTWAVSGPPGSAAGPVAPGPSSSSPAGQATPGYLPGELEPGEWQVVLGLYQLPAAGASYTLTAEVTSAPGRLGPAPPPAPPAPLTSRPPRRDLGQARAPLAGR